MHRVLKIVEELKKLLLEDFLAKEISIFLCGGASKKQARFRFELGRRLESITSSYVYKIYYPETIFSEILLSHSELNLLNLEKFLAENVNAVVIPLQSPGTFVELGAFSNHEVLRNKLVVLMNPKYRKNTSFINDGPIKLLRGETSSRIIYSSMEDNSDIENLVKRIPVCVREISKKMPIIPIIENPLVAQFFYIALIYVFDPIDTRLLQLLLQQILSGNADVNKNARAETIVSSILKQGSVKLLENRKLSLFEEAFTHHLQKSGFNSSQIINIKKKLSDLRIDAINYYYRKKGIKIGRETFTP